MLTDLEAAYAKPSVHARMLVDYGDGGEAEEQRWVEREGDKYRYHEVKPAGSSFESATLPKSASTSNGLGVKIYFDMTIMGNQRRSYSLHQLDIESLYLRFADAWLDYYQEDGYVTSVEKVQHAGREAWLVRLHHDAVNSADAYTQMAFDAETGFVLMRLYTQDGAVWWKHETIEFEQLEEIDNDLFEPVYPSDTVR